MNRNPYAPPAADVGRGVSDPSALQRPFTIKLAVVLMLVPPFVQAARAPGDWKFLLGFPVAIFFVYHILRGRNWARIAYLILKVPVFILVIILSRYLPNVMSSVQVAPRPTLVGSVAILSTIASLVLLFTPPGRNWFRRRTDGQ